MSDSFAVKTIDGFIFDFSQITRRERNELLQEARDADTSAERDERFSRLLVKVLVKWPFDQDITADTFQDLPWSDSVRVENAFTKANELLSKKN